MLGAEVKKNTKSIVQEQQTCAHLLILMFVFESP